LGELGEFCKKLNWIIHLKEKQYITIMGELEAFDAAFVQMCKKEGVPLLSSRGNIKTYINDMG